MKARILVPLIGASLALIGPAAHAAGAHNALHCTVAKQAHTATALKPFFSPLNPRGLLAAQAKRCAAKKVVVHKPKLKPQPQPQPQPPLVTTSTGSTLPTTPTVSGPYCPVDTGYPYPQAELAPCVPADPSTVAAPAQAAQDTGSTVPAAQDTSGATAPAAQNTSGEPPLADV